MMQVGARFFDYTLLLECDVVAIRGGWIDHAYHLVDVFTQLFADEGKRVGLRIEE